MHIRPRPVATAGNAIVIAMGAFTIAAVLVATAVDGAVIGRQTARQSTDHQQVLAALDAVLAKREKLVVERASQGDPAEIARWNGNFGVDFIGGTEVRWKIEPVRTPPRDAAGTPVHHIANPPPDPNWTPPTTPVVPPVPPATVGEPAWEANDTNFLFRIAGEARLGRDSGGQPTAVVQGARYCSVLKEPLFRYVIFYAARGPKGDLELSHADAVNIQGAVHSNGALYIGGGLKVNDRVARLGSIDGSLNPTSTSIGPDVAGKEVRVNGVDGIFRLSKPLMFSLINDFPLTNSATASTGSPTDTSMTSLDWTAAGAYDASAVTRPSDPTGVTWGGSIAAATADGRLINPYRIKEGSAAVTENKKGNQDDLRKINNVAIRGSAYGGATTGDKIANDARDAERTAAQSWNTVSLQTSAPGFAGFARTRQTGQGIKNLPERMRDRGLDAQRLSYPDFDGDSTTDEHHLARPRFMKADGTSTTEYPTPGRGFPQVGANALIYEEAGQYLRYALGSDQVFMLRDPAGRGWSLRRLDNTPLPSDPAAPGLIIRERAIPEPLYWPGTNTPTVVAPSDPRWLPFAYGKHFFPSTFRFTVADISDVLYPSNTVDSLAVDRINTTDTARSISYAPGGRLTVTAAQYATGNSLNYFGATNVYRRKPYFYGQNWRFVNLNQHTINTGVNGLRVTAFDDRPTGISNSLSLCANILPVTTPASGVVDMPRISTTPYPAPNTSFNGRRSARFEGFLTASDSNLYYFGAWLGGSQYARIWVNGRLAWSNWGGVAVNQPQRLTANVPVPFQVDWGNDGSGSPSLNVYWQPIEPILGAQVIIPSARFNPPAGQVGFDRASFTAVQVRIDRPMTIPGPAQQKIGVMLTDGSGGMSPLLNGSAAYAFLGFSPTRGVFSERRGVRHLQEQRTIGTYYIGDGNGPNGAADTKGEIIDNPDTVAAVNRTAKLTQVAVSGVTVGSVINEAVNTQTSGTTWTTTPSLFSGTMSKDVGGGKVWTILDNFNVGTYAGTRTQYKRQRKYQTATQILTLELSGHVAPFDDINDADGYDHNRSMLVYTNPTGTGKYNPSLSPSANTNNIQIRYDAAYLAGGTPPTGYWYMYGGSTGNRIMLRRTYPRTNYTGYVNGATVTQTITVGGAGTIWKGTDLRINKNGTITTATVADINTVTGGAFTEIRSGTPNTPWVGPAPANPDISGLADPTVPTAPQLPDFTGAGRTFSIQRSGSTITFDLNSFVTASCTWLATAAQQFLPTLGSGWPLTWVGNTPTTWPMTQGFRPDVATGGSAVGHSAVAVNPTGAAGLQLASGYAMADDTAVAPTTTELWLRIENSGGLLTFKYYAGTTPPANAAAFTTLPGTLDISGWGPSLLIGPALQSGNVSQTTTAVFTNMRVETSLPAPNDVIDATEWDTDTSGQDVMGRYLASQYQVWWGVREITEDFFTWTDPVTGRRMASEEWLYQPREFWSQSRWWDHVDSGGNRVSKDPDAANFTNTRMREALAKTTLLTLDMEAVQNYLRTRLLSEAVADRMTGVAHDTAMGAPGTDYVLNARFNGLFYAARTNRFPWNPNANPALPAMLDDGSGGYTEPLDAINPWSPDVTMRMNNPAAGNMDTLSSERANDATLRGWAVDGTYGDLLQPYSAADLPIDPPLRPEQFHHGIRLKNAASIDWGFSGVRGTSSTRTIGTSGTTATTWAWAPQPEFGASKTSIVTPNALYVQGNFNVDQHIALKNGVAEPTFTPTAIMGDSINLLSNAWNDDLYTVAGLTVANVSGAGSVSGSGTLACTTLGAFASDTEYNVAIATHNQPSTRNRVAEGQSAPFVDTTMFLENWNGRSMSYMGSLVVMDSRRYTRAFLHDTFKTYGQTPLGIVDNDGSWLAKLNAINLYGSAATVGWLGRSPVIYSEPTRVYQFNYDLLTEEGTPPFAPFGVSTSGVGGWARIIR